MVYELFVHTTLASCLNKQAHMKRSYLYETAHLVMRAWRSVSSLSMYRELELVCRVDTVPLEKVKKIHSALPRMLRSATSRALHLFPSLLPPELTILIPCLRLPVPAPFDCRNTHVNSYKFAGCPWFSLNIPAPVSIMMRIRGGEIAGILTFIDMPSRFFLGLEVRKKKLVRQ